jgi:hypothetical protein
MHDYIPNITLAKGSGEYCISHILAPGAHARLPLVDRIQPLKIPVTFVCALPALSCLVVVSSRALQMEITIGWTLKVAVSV